MIWLRKNATIESETAIKSMESLLKFHIVCLFDHDFLQNRSTDFDETLYVAQACPVEGLGTTGMSRYPLV